MKKFTFSTIALLGVFAVFSWAGTSPRQASFRTVPTGPGSALQSADYGGVDYSTVAVSSVLTLISSGETVVHGFVASSGTAVTDFISFCDTSSATTDVISNEFARVYISSNSNTAGAVLAANNGLGMTYRFPYPIRCVRGLAVKVSVATYNMITILYERFSQ